MAMTQLLTILMAIFALSNTAQSAPAEGKNTMTGGHFGNTDMFRLDRSWLSEDKTTKGGMYGELVQNPTGLQGALGAHVSKTFDMPSGDLTARGHAEVRKFDFGATTNTFGGDLTKNWNGEDGSTFAKTYAERTAAQFGPRESKTDTFGVEVGKTWDTKKSEWTTSLFAEHENPSSGPSRTTGGVKIQGKF